MPQCLPPLYRVARASYSVSVPFWSGLILCLHLWRRRAAQPHPAATGSESNLMSNLWHSKKKGPWRPHRLPLSRHEGTAKAYPAPLLSEYLWSLLWFQGLSYSFAAWWHLYWLSNELCALPVSRTESIGFIPRLEHAWASQGPPDV